MSDQSLLTKRDIEGAANWGAPKEVQTKHGPMLLRKASLPAPLFSDLYKAHKEEVKALGANFSKNRDDEWELVWWLPLPKAEIQRRAKSVIDSRAMELEEDIEIPAPDGLEYMPFQKVGIKFAYDHPGVLIADEMGAGKTIETLGLINLDTKIKSTIIVCPKSLKLNWQRESERWLVRDLTVGRTDDKGNWPDTDIVITHYEALGKFEEQIEAKEWDICVLDETHLIKNYRATRSKRAKAIKSKRKVRLTGTPICNRPSELYNIINDLCEGWGSWRTFCSKYANGHDSQFGFDASGASRLPELQKRLRGTVMIRRLKKDVLKELPPKIRQVVELDPMTKEEQRAVQAEIDFERESERRLADLRAQVELAKAEGEEAYRTAVDRLRDAGRVDFSEFARLRKETAMAKVPAVAEHVRMALESGSEKIVIGVHHHEVCDLLIDALDNYRPVWLTGRDSEEHRQQAIDDFQSDPDVRVFIGSIGAAGLGITLTASSHLVMAELDPVPGRMSQYEDRVHRHGQTVAVLIQHLVFNGSIDARIAKILVEKQRIIDQALDIRHPERNKDVYEPREVPSTKSAKVKDIEILAGLLKPQQISVVHGALQYLAALDNDRAMNVNGIGFNKIDSLIGHSLADADRLTPKQAALGYGILRKYHGQLSPEEIGTLEEIKRITKA